MSDKEVIQHYLSIIQQFTEGELSAADFSIRYMDEFIEEDSDFSEEVYIILQTLFAEAEAYCENPELRDERDINEAELMEVALDTEEKLQNLERE